MDWASMDAGQIFLVILEVVSNSITTLLGMLPNPDPFPEIIANVDFNAENGALFAGYWLDQFFDATFIIGITVSWLFMFPIAWIIMMLWKWLKAR